MTLSVKKTSARQRFRRRLVFSVAALAGCSSMSTAPAPRESQGHTARPHSDVSEQRRAARERAWVALENDNRLALVDVREGRVVKKKRVAGGPHNLVASHSGRTVVAALWHAERVAIIRKGAVKHVYLGGAPHDVKIGGRRIVVANQGSNRLQLLSLRGKRRGKVMLRANPHDVAIAPNNYIAWATLEGDDALARVHLKKKKVLRYVSTAEDPHDILFSPGGHLWVTDWNGAVHVYSRKGKHLRSRALGDEAHHLAFTPDGRHVWITDHGAHRVFVIATKTLKVVRSFAINGAPHHVTITRGGARAVVADHDRGLLRVYSATRLERLLRVRVGKGPHGVWSVP